MMKGIVFFLGSGRMCLTIRQGRPTRAEDIRMGRPFGRSSSRMKVRTLEVSEWEPGRQSLIRNRYRGFEGECRTLGESGLQEAVGGKGRRGPVAHW